MDQKQDLVYNCVRDLIYANNQEENGVTTQQIAQRLHMQRTNASAFLNRLVRLGKLTKVKTRPVRYLFPDRVETIDAFETLIGASGSLQKAIQLSKAAVLYPQNSLNIQIIAHDGSGTSCFVEKIIQFAAQNNIFSQDAPHLNINCRNYASDVHELDDILFGPNADFHDSYFESARNGSLFINHFDYLDAGQQAKIINFFDQKENTDLAISKPNLQPRKPLIIFSCSTQTNPQLANKVPVTITLPTLDERPIKEKFDLITKFFTDEAKVSQHVINVDIPAFKALLLANYVHNIKEIQNCIRMACANAYVRVVNEPGQRINLYLEDLDPAIRKSLLREKENKITLDVLFQDNQKMSFTPTDVNTDKNLVNDHLYKNINKQYADLVDRGVGGKSIQHTISTRIKKLFDKYNYYDSLDSNFNQAQLAKVVDPKIITIVKNWLIECSQSLECTFKNSVFYGLCLHINSLINLKTVNQRISSKQAQKLSQQYPEAYKESVKLIQVLNSQLNLSLPFEETVLVMMFLITPTTDTDQTHPVVLYIMHGNGTAQSLMETTNTLNQNCYSYAYDMSLDTDTSVAKTEIKKKIQQIDQGKGVIVIYDMGSIKVMLDTISEELTNKIRTIQFPITLIGIDAARKCSMENDIESVYHSIKTDIRHTFGNDEQKDELIVTLCHTGEGGAIQLKEYIDQYSHLGMRVKALSMSDKSKLIDAIIALQKIYKIHAFVGTYDPRLFGIPFIPINKIFEKSSQDLDQILMFKPISSPNLAYSEIYTYFKSQFKYTSISTLQQVMPEFMDKLSLSYELHEDQRIGLFVHIGCLIERILSGAQETQQPQEKVSAIIHKFPTDYTLIAKLFKPIEHAFNVIITDDELATIIMIIKKI